MRIGSIIIFHLSKLWKAKFSILCDFSRGCTRNLILITLGNERVLKTRNRIKIRAESRMCRRGFILSIVALRADRMNEVEIFTSPTALSSCAGFLTLVVENLAAVRALAAFLAQGGGRTHALVGWPWEGYTRINKQRNKRTNKQACSKTNSYSNRPNRVEKLSWRTSTVKCMHALAWPLVWVLAMFAWEHVKTKHSSALLVSCQTNLGAEYV